jgi:two-component system response regulator HydG
VRRLGSTYARKADVRVIAATHRDLKACVQAGTFREDLLYRLEVIGIHVPPLRARMEDVPDLAYHFLRMAAQRHGKAVDGIGEEAMARLLAHSWPGNVRELSNVMERAVVFARGAYVELADLPQHLASLPLSDAVPPVGATSISVPLGTPLKDVEDLLIRKTLEATSGDKNMTARLLGINSRTIYRKLDKRESGEPGAPEDK